MCNITNWQDFITNCNLIIDCADKIYKKQCENLSYSIDEENFDKKNREHKKIKLSGKILQYIYDNDAYLSNLYNQADGTIITNNIIRELATDLEKNAKWEMCIESAKCIVKCVDKIYANPENKSLLKAAKVNVHEDNVEEVKIKLNGNILKFICNNLANDEYCVKICNQEDIISLIQYITSKYTEQLKKLASWQNFITNSTSENLLSLINDCAKLIYKNPSIKSLLRHIGLDVDKVNSDSVKTELAGLIFIFIRDNLEDNIYFADLYRQGDYTRLVQNIARAFIMDLREIVRNKDYYRNYYRRCREAFYQSREIICRRIVDTNGRDLGISFAPAVEDNAPDALRPLFFFDEYKTIPSPPDMLQKNIRRSADIVKSGIFFWDNAAAIKGKHFFLLQEFVNYIQTYFDLNIAIQTTTVHVNHEDYTDDIDQVIPDSEPDTGPSIHNLELAEYLELNLTELEMDVLCYLLNESGRQAIMEALGLSEYRYKMIRRRLKEVWYSFYEKR